MYWSRILSYALIKLSTYVHINVCVNVCLYNDYRVCACSTLKCHNKSIQSSGVKTLNAKSSQGFAATAWKVRKASNHGFVGSLGFWSVLIAVAQGMAFTAAIVLWRRGLSSGPGCRCDGPGMSNWGRPWPKKWENLLCWRRGRKT